MRTRHVTVAVYHTLLTNARCGQQGPVNWFVYDAIPWSKGKVMLEVGKTRHQPSDHPPRGHARADAEPDRRH